MTVMTKSGVRLERREYERAWMAVVAGWCGIALLVLLFLFLMGNLVLGCMKRYTPNALADGGWQEAQRQETAQQCAWMRENWAAGRYGNELCDRGE